MNRRILGSVAALAMIVSAGSVVAKQYVDYTPQKGVWEINAIQVDPNHLDDYLTGLRKTQVPVLEIMKRRGMIDDYRIFTRIGYMKDAPSVMIQTHFVSAAMMEPDKARDEAIEKEVVAGMSEADGRAAVAGYEKYRTFIDDGLWGEVKMAK